MADITLTLLTGNDREQFILDNQRAFKLNHTMPMQLWEQHP